MLGWETSGRTGFSREGAEVVFHLVCSGMLGLCLECAFELGPHVFPFTPSAGNAIARSRGKAGLPGSLGASGRMVILCRKSEVSFFVSRRGRSFEACWF